MFDPCAAARLRKNKNKTKNKQLEMEEEKAASTNLARLSRHTVLSNL